MDCADAFPLSESLQVDLSMAEVTAFVDDESLAEMYQVSNDVAAETVLYFLAAHLTVAATMAETSAHTLYSKD